MTEDPIQHRISPCISASHESLQPVLDQHRPQPRRVKKKDGQVASWPASLARCSGTHSSFKDGLLHPTSVREGDRSVTEPRIYVAAPELGVKKYACTTYGPGCCLQRYLSGATSATCEGLYIPAVYPQLSHSFQPKSRPPSPEDVCPPHTPRLWPSLHRCPDPRHPSSSSHEL